jgi:outer membrane protein
MDDPAPIPRFCRIVTRKTKEYPPVNSKSRLVVLSLAVAAVAGAMLAPPLAAAQDTAAGGYKIGIVDMQTVLADYQKRRESYSRLEAEVKSRQAEIDRLSNEIEAMKKDYEARRESMSESERSDLRKRIEDKYAEYRTKLDANQREIDRREEEVLKEVFKDVEAAIKSLAEREGYHLIMNGRSQPRGAVLYYSTTIDVTGSLLAALNAGAGTSAPPAQDSKKKR